MKQIVRGFFHRGTVALGFGPLILAAVYLVLQQRGALTTLTVKEVCVGILSLSLLAFVAGGMNVVYQIERLPLMAAITIHGGVLYASYLAAYLVNGWLDRGVIPLLVFTGVFAVGYLLIWAVIYGIIRRRADRLNAMLQQERREE